MAFASIDDVEVYMGCPISAAERGAFASMLAGLSDDVVAVIGAVETGSDVVLTFRPEEPGVEIRVPSPLTDVTSVEVNGTAVTVDRFTTSGVIVVADEFDAGDEIVVTYDAGSAVPARLTKFVASKIAGAFQMARAQHAYRAANPTGMVESKTIGSTSVTLAAGPDAAEFMAAGAARMLVITDEERKWLRRSFDRQTTTARVR